MLNLPPVIITVLCHFAPLFSRPTYQKLLTLTMGHLLCRGRRTITNCLRSAGLSKEQRYSEFYDVFRRASWSSFKASKVLLFLIDKKFVKGGVLRITIDTSLERRRGPRIHGTGMHRDAVRSSKTKKAFSPGHNWLIACVLIRFPGTKTVWSLPFMSILLRPKKSTTMSKSMRDKLAGRRHKKFTTYTEQLVHVLRRWLGPEREIVLVGDSAFCCRRICRACIKRRVMFCTRFRLDAALYEPPPPPTGKRGRKRVVGNRLSSLSEIASDLNTVWETHEVPWYGGNSHKVDLASGTALWYHNSLGKPVPIRWVLSRDHENPNEAIPFLCTNQNCSHSEIIECIVQRWSIETTFQEVRFHMGYESIYTWADKGIERVSPAIMASYSIVCLVAATAMEDKNEQIQPQKSAWYNKTHVTFSDVHSYVKSLIIKESIFPHPAQNRPLSKKIIYDMLYWAMAA